MSIERGKSVGVLTGDLVDSRHLPAATRKDLRIFSDEHLARAQEYFDLHTTNLAWFSGDSWQVAIQPASMVVTTALYFRAGIKGVFDDSQPAVDTRISMGLGQITVVDDDVRNCDGPAFDSSSALEWMKIDPEERLWLYYPKKKSPDGMWLAFSLVRLIDVITRGWTPAQCRVFCGIMENLTQTKIAATFSPPISQQAVAKHLSRANADTIKAALMSLSSSLKEWYDDPS